MDIGYEGGVILDLFILTLVIYDVVVDREYNPDEDSAEERISFAIGGHVVDDQGYPEDDDGSSFFVDRDIWISDSEALEQPGCVEDGSSSNPSCIHSEATSDYDPFTCVNFGPRRLHHHIATSVQHENYVYK